MKRLHGGFLLAVLAVAFVFACATTQSRWETAQSTDTIAAYEDFLKKCPEGDLADRARMRRNELYEERDWKDAEAINTVAAYQAFMKKYPQGRHKTDVYVRLQVLSLPRISDLPSVSSGKLLEKYRQGIFMDDALSTPEKLSFERAKAQDTIAAYDGYLNRYPQGLFADEARSRREELSSVNVHPANPVQAWGTIMYPRPNTNIRAKRSAASGVKGQLKAGEPVKADFLQDAWYAVFPVTQKQRNEKMAFGYVSAPLLSNKRGANSPGSAAPAKKTAGNAPPIKMERESLPVDVKNMTFKVAGEGRESLLIGFDRFYIPAISEIDGNEHRIILEITNASSLRGDWTSIETGGNCIRRIHSSRDPQTRAALIVLDMVREKNYLVSQAFDKKGNIYSVEISEKKEMQLPFNQIRHSAFWNAHGR